METTKEQGEWKADQGKVKTKVDTNVSAINQFNKDCKLKIFSTKGVHGSGWLDWILGIYQPKPT